MTSSPSLRLSHEIDPSSQLGQALARARARITDVEAAMWLVVGLVDSADVSGGDGAFRHLIVLDPGGVGWAAWGRFLLNQGRTDNACCVLARAAKATPTRAQTWSDFANALETLKLPSASASVRAVALSPGDASYLYNLGCDRQDADRLEDAGRLFRRARLVAPDLADAWARAASVALLTHQPAKMTAYLRLAMSLAPTSPPALTGLGVWFGRADDRALAMKWYDRAILSAPYFAEAILNRGLERLRSGLLATGWADYEWRFASRGYLDRALPAPRWRGQPLAGKTIFAWGEQGVGDEILFSSCLADLAAMARHVVVECDQRLKPLFARSFPTIRFVCKGEATGGAEYDYHTPMGSAPAYLRARLSDFRNPAPWLRPDPEAAARWRDRLAALPAKLNVGLAWRSGLLTSDRVAAYTDLRDWAPLFALSDVNIINLQYGDCADELAAAKAQFGGHLHQWPDLIDLKDDLDELAALVSSLDLVICPATAVGELAAAVGAPVWRLGASDWTMLGAAVRPWHGMQRLFMPQAGEDVRQTPLRVVSELRRQRAAAHDDAETVAGNFDAALALYRNGDLVGAAAICAALLRRAAVEGRARHLAAVIANRQERFLDAATALAPVVGSVDETPAAITTLCVALIELKRSRSALALAPADHGVLSAAGLDLMASGRVQSAIEMTRRALIVNDSAAARSNLAMMLDKISDEAGAINAYRQALARDAKHAPAHYNLGLLLLRLGQLRDGWAEHDWRFATPQFAGQGVRLSASLWRGENIAGKRLLIWREQGVGDEIMFASCYGDAIARAGAVAIQCDRRLTSLLARSFPDAQFVPEGAPLPSCDIHSPAGSLPRRLRANLRSFEARGPWLVADPRRAALWRARVEALGPGMKVGLAWRSGLMTAERVNAYIRLKEWAPVLQTPGLRFVNLQYSDVADEIAEVMTILGVEIATWEDLDLKNDFENVAALTSCLDLVLAPATSVGELAAALGTPTWRLAGRDWTGLGSAVRPWHPSMRVWAPRLGESLNEVPVAMARALAQLVASAAPVRIESAEKLTARAQICFAQGSVVAARETFSAALAVDRANSAAWLGVGACQAEASAFQSADLSLRRALALAPADAAALTTFGNVAMARGDADAAMIRHLRAIWVAPQLTPAWDNLGVALLALGEDRRAESCHRRAMADDLTALGPWINLSAALRRQGRFKEAGEALRRALALAPAEEDVFANMTRLDRMVRQTTPDDPWARRGKRLAPHSPAIAFNHGLSLLAAGRLEEGWEGYDRRYDAPSLVGAAPHLDIPAWRGAPLNGRRLLVWGEQGVGDQILFASMLPDLIALAQSQGGNVVVSPEPRLAKLFQQSFPQATVIADVSQAAALADVHCGMGSLGRLLRRKLSDFSSAAPYLRPSPEASAFWRARLFELPPGLKVGLAWRSGLLTGERLHEYTDLADWRALLTMRGVTVVNLMYDADHEIKAAADSGLRIYGWEDLDLKNDFAAVAALMAELDLVISPATSSGELAAAVGAPTWRFGMLGDWTRLGTQIRPWLATQSVFTPALGETLKDLALGISVRLARSRQ